MVGHNSVSRVGSETIAKSFRNMARAKLRAEGGSKFGSRVCARNVTKQEQTRRQRMRNHALLINCSVALALIAGISGQANAQSAAPATPAATPPATTPAPSAPGAAAPTTPATPVAAQPAPAAAPATAPAPADAAAAPATPATPAEPPPASYFRIDDDYAFGLQLWAGATHSLGGGVGLATDIYIDEVEYGAYNAKGAAGKVPYSWYGEFDIGPAFTFGPLALTPMVGVGYDWGAKHVTAINGPQLYTILNTDSIYIESWIWTLLYSPFKEQPLDDYFHTRDWILYKLSGTVAVGPQVELWTNMQSKISGHKGVTSLPVGLHADIGYGTGNTLGLFVGYEANKYGRDSHGGNAAVGRFTFVHNF